MAEDCCDTCFYARPDPSIPPYGQLRCHKNAPLWNDGDTAQFPPCPLAPNDWCGWYSLNDPNIYGIPAAAKAKPAPKAKAKAKAKAKPKTKRK
jgi:hypothetical protein